MSLHVSVERTIAAPPAAIFAYLSDAARHPEIDGSGTVVSARSRREPLELGTVFGMSMHRGVGYRTKNTVVEFEQDRLIAWRTTALGGLIGGRVWRYKLEPQPDGRTLVRETWDISHDKQRLLLQRGKTPAGAKVGMRRTLERLGQLVEA